MPPTLASMAWNRMFSCQGWPPCARPITPAALSLERGEQFVRRGRLFGDAGLFERGLRVPDPGRHVDVDRRRVKMSVDLDDVQDRRRHQLVPFVAQRDVVDVVERSLVDQVSELFGGVELGGRRRIAADDAVDRHRFAPCRRRRPPYRPRCRRRPIGVREFRVAATRRPRSTSASPPPSVRRPPRRTPSAPASPPPSKSPRRWPAPVPGPLFA